MGAVKLGNIWNLQIEKYHSVSEVNFLSNLTPSLRFVHWFGGSIGRPWWSIGRLLGWRGLVGCLGGLERLIEILHIIYNTSLATTEHIMIKIHMTILFL